jgi:hypothetical protein
MTRVKAGGPGGARGPSPTSTLTGDDAAPPGGATASTARDLDI